jgi:hypothetical protein
LAWAYDNGWRRLTVKSEWWHHTYHNRTDKELYELFREENKCDEKTDQLK